MCLQDILIGNGKLAGPHSVKYDLPGRVDVGGTVTAKDIIIASGSVPFVPPGASISTLRAHTWKWTAQSGNGRHEHAVYLHFDANMIQPSMRGPENASAQPHTCPQSGGCES
jgi:hypothetical protein